jgi:hypothetical protein
MVTIGERVYCSGKCAATEFKKKKKDDILGDFWDNLCQPGRFLLILGTFFASLADFC